MKNQNISAPTGKIIRLGDGAFITVFMNGESLTLRASESQAKFDQALEAIQNEDWVTLYEAMRPVKHFAQKLNNVTVTDGGVYFDGEPVHSAIATRIMDFAMSGLDHAPLCKFLEKLMQNPSRRAIQELYTFLEHRNLPITDNGNFLAYKGLESNYYSITAGTAKLIKGRVNSNNQIYNGIGEEIEMKRQDVCDDKDIGCSYGLHAGSLEYATSFARGKCVIVEINPKDVVSIPTDCSFQKLRTCAYKVVGEYDQPLSNPLYESRWQDVDNIGDDFSQYNPDIEFDTPSSDWINSVKYYDANPSQTLLMQLADGRCIVHKNVPENLATRFRDHVQSGKSAGTFYNLNIRDSY